jgi:hypothetical protein
LGNGLTDNFVLKEYFMRQGTLYRWLPASRDEIIAMVLAWIAICTDKRTLWGIAGVALTELTRLKDAGQKALPFGLEFGGMGALYEYSA